METRTIAIDCKCFYSLSGVSRYLENVLDNILTIDKKNKYYLLTPKNFHILDKYRKFPNVSIIDFNTENEIFYKFFFISSFIKKNEVNIFWTPTQDGLLFPIKNCKIFITIHDIAFEHHRNWFNLRVKILSYLGLYKYFFKNSNFAFYVSEFTKADTERTYSTSKENVVTYLGATDTFKYINKSEAKEYVKNYFEFSGEYIFYLDSVRFENLFSAFKIFIQEYPNVKLVCLGKFDGIDIKLYAEKMGIGENIFWIKERISDLDLNNLYSGAEFFISPSFYEGFGLTPLEALQSGTPVIVSNVTSLPEVYGESALYVDPSDIEDIFIKMKQLYLDTNQRNEILQKSKKLFLKYNWKNVSSIILDSFNSIKLVNKDNAEKDEKIFLKYIKFLSSYISFEDMKILDIGCAKGSFVKTLEDNFNTFDFFGVDYNSDSVMEMKNQNYKVENFDLDRDLPLPFQEEFDTICMFDVIEHLNNFKTLDRILNKNLKKGGYFILTTPNSDALQRFIDHYGYTGEFDPTHRILFTSYTLDFFLRRRGLVKVFNYTPYIFSFKKNLFNQYLKYGGQIFALYRKK